ncbi:hypothetical protein BDN72DRAFT_963526 [Pluteus cervinus]|uniref:Uncharacterized protein n=1 Tax=Pluteus cervinus TaxID=181527 RepID=A0ACD3AE39_9AGAR|nr:hypothetical protein BDN72DRAFT_963526 [Pluteus cervinus]
MNASGNASLQFHGLNYITNVIQKLTESPRAQEYFKGSIALLWKGQRVDYTAFDEFPFCRASERRVTSSIIAWAEKVDVEKAVFWLSGYTGSGLTTVAQLVATQLNARRCLAGSYFVSQSRPETRCAGSIIPTLAYRIAVTIPQTLMIFSEVLGDDTIFQKQPSTQWEELIRKPLLPFGIAQQVIVIDGLHDCEDKAQQVVVLTAILEAAKRTPSVKVVISCKPERHLQQVFEKFELPAECQAVLCNSAQDRLEVRTFLTDSFSQIRHQGQTKQTMRPVEGPWPTPAVLERLVDAASGQFLFAKATIDYVDHTSDDPADRLQELSEDPFRVLKAMESCYTLFLERAFSDAAQIPGSMHSLIIHLLIHHHNHSSPLRLSHLARLWTKGDCPEVRRTLAPLGLELHLPEDNNGVIQFRHESFVQYMSRLYSLFPRPPLVNITHSGPIAAKCFQMFQITESAHPQEFIHFASTHSLDYCGCSIPTVDIVSYLSISARLERLPWTTDDLGYLRFMDWLENQRFLGWLSVQFQRQGPTGLVQHIKFQLQLLAFLVIGVLYYRALQLGHAFEYAKDAADSWPDFAETAGVYPHLDMVVRFIRLIRSYRRPTPNVATKRLIKDSSS